MIMTNRYTLFLSAALVMGAVLTGCNEQKKEPKEPLQEKTYTLRIASSKSKDGNKKGPRKVLGFDGSELTSKWKMGEQVHVYNVTKEKQLSGYITPESEGKTTTFLAGNLKGVVETEDRLQLEYLSASYTDQKGTLDYISSTCDYSVSNVVVASIAGDRINTTEDAVFANQQAVVKLSIFQEDGTTPISPTSLIINDGTSDIATLTDVPDATYTANGAGIVYVAIPGFSSKNITFTAQVGSDTYSYTTPDTHTLENGKYYDIKIKMTLVPNVVHGFSISPTQQIEFAHGNLQFQPSTGTWRIAREQYDFVGDEDAVYSNGSNDFTKLGTVYESDTKSNNLKFVSETESPFKDLVDPDYTGWMDLFGWNTANNPLKKDLAKSAYTSTPFVDWGHNPIYDPNADITYPADTWRTLSRAEYEYIFCKRPNAQQKLGLASLEGHEKGVIKGVIILPDEFVMPSELESKGFKNILQTHDYEEGEGTYNSRSRYICKTGAIAHYDMTSEIFESDSYIYNQNSYTIAEWEKLEEAGAVFLPAAGRRDLTTRYDDLSVIDYIFVWFVGRMAVYWTSTPNEGGGEEPHAWICTCDDQHFSLGHTQSPCQGQSVRLVRDIPQP